MLGSDGISIRTGATDDGTDSALLNMATICSGEGASASLLSGYTGPTTATPMSWSSSTDLETVCGSIKFQF